MATRRPPLTKTREFDYSNVGKAGRRTGITLKEGKRDEHGMEDLEGMFSSPEKSPPRVNGNGYSNDHVANSEDMDMGGSSSIPDPADVLSARRGGRNAYFPPPRSRSPMKTLMSGSPRRTPGLRSSPLAHSDQMSSPTTNRVAAKRNMNMLKPAASQPEKSPLNKLRPFPVKSKRHNLSENESEEEMELVADEAPDFSDDGSHLLEKEVEEEEDTHFSEAYGDYHEGGHLSNPDDEEIEQLEEEEPAPEVSPAPAAKSAGRGRKRKEISHDAQGASREQQEADNDNPTHPPVKRRGRPQKAQPTAEQGDGNPRPAKKAKKANKESTLKMTAEQETELNNVVERITKKDGPLKQRSLYILRRETPSGDNVFHTRSGRVSVRPLAYWRNEKCVFGSGEAEIGQRFPVSTIKEIIRTEEPEPTYSKTKKRGSKKNQKGRNERRDEESEDEPEDAVEPWETQGGIFVGPVKMWDTEQQTSSPEEEMMDVAYAPSAIDTQEVRNASFRFAKILSTPFLGSGFVEMPPGAVKGKKNSKRMHLVFFVFKGRIRVELSGLQFSAGKGSVFQVPRGNNYSLANEHNSTAMVFFTQGCIPLDEDGKIDTGVPAPPTPNNAHVAQGQTIAETIEKPTKIEKPSKKKGRPKRT
ncbi:hypothetical protein FQN57_005586 [Myotisia sp. PD_48]|nr:hypothetical protein FQN57_005586 [Myotisia sp. PD_48]